MEVKRHPEHGGLVVRVRKLALKGAVADVDVAKTGAWLQAHGVEVKEFGAYNALHRACSMRNGHSARGAWLPR